MTPAMVDSGHLHSHLTANLEWCPVTGVVNPANTRPGSPASRILSTALTTKDILGFRAGLLCSDPGLEASTVAAATMHPVFTEFMNSIECYGNVFGTLLSHTDRRISKE